MLQVRFGYKTSEIYGPAAENMKRTGNIITNTYATIDAVMHEKESLFSFESDSDNNIKCNYSAVSICVLCKCIQIWLAGLEYFLKNVHSYIVDKIGTHFFKK